MIGKMTLEGHFKKTSMIGMTLRSNLASCWVFWATKKNAPNKMNSFIQNKTYRNFRTNTRYFPFKARKETHEQCKTKIDIDEFRTGTTNITHPQRRQPIPIGVGGVHEPLDEGDNDCGNLSAAPA
jgi:hypothetical protein